MLAAGGVLGLLLMGAAVSGLMSGAEGDARLRDDDDPGPEADPEPEAGDADGARPGMSWLDDFAADGSLSAASPGDIGNAPLARLLFGDRAAPTGTGHPTQADPADPDAAQAAEDHEDVFAGLDTVAAFDAPLAYDVLETVAFPGGPDIPCVSAFDCDTDRLILDFDGTADEAPLITVDLQTSPGNAVVEANGVAVTLVAGATGFTADHVDVVMSGVSAADAMPAPSEEGPFGGPETSAPSAGPFGEGGDGTHGAFLGTIHDFDPEADQIEILYDPDLVPDPTIEVVDFEDGTGARILMNGEPLLHVVGAQGLDVSGIALLPTGPEAGMGAGMGGGMTQDGT